jgi:hypothetical protein
MKVVKYSEYSKINEEFVLSAIKGALGKLFGFFANAFKDLGADFKSMFKEDDPSTIKDIVMKNVDQAVDGAQKEITNLKSDGDVLGIVDNMVTQLVELGNNITKDVEGALGKEKSKPVEEISKALLLGNKEVDWVGIVGALDPAAGILKKDINFAYSKKKFVESVNKGKDLNQKKTLASKFLDDFQKTIRAELEKAVTDEEIKTLYDKMKGGDAGTDLELKEGDMVVYLLKGKKKEEFDEKKKPEEQKDVVGVKKIEKIDGDKITFLDKDGKPTILKTKAEILKKVEVEMGQNAKKVADSLGKIKQDEEKMGKVATFAEFIQDDKNKDKLAEIEKILSGGEQPAAQA